MEAINGDSLSFQEAAARTGLDFTVIENAIQAGLLTQSYSKGTRRIPSENVKRFNARYVPLACLAKKLGTSTKRLLRECLQHRLPTVLLPRSSGRGDQPIVGKEHANLLTGTKI